MANEHVEKTLKEEIQKLERKLKKTETLRLAGWIGSMVGAGLVLSAMADQIPVVVAIGVGGALLNIMTTSLVSRKK